MLIEPQRKYDAQPLDQVEASNESSLDGFLRAAILVKNENVLKCRTQGHVYVTCMTSR